MLVLLSQVLEQPLTHVCVIVSGAGQSHKHRQSTSRAAAQ